MKILIVDDSRTMRNLLKAYVALFATRIGEAADGEEALSLLEASPDFEIALIDWDMPVMNGLDLVRVIRADRRFNQVKLMMVTAQNSFESVAEALECGADDYLMKPVTMEMVHDKLRILGVCS